MFLSYGTEYICLTCFLILQVNNGWGGTNLQSEKVADVPHKVIQTRTIQEYLAEHIPQDLQRKVLREAMEAKTVVVYKGTATETDAPDHTVRTRALSLLGDFMGSKTVNVRQTNVNVNMTPEDMRAMFGFG